MLDSWHHGSRKLPQHPSPLRGLRWCCITRSSERVRIETFGLTDHPKIQDASPAHPSGCGLKLAVIALVWLVFEHHP
ncbi:MAG: hypothetical protein ABFS39_19865, partial [Pseudomonadota bacterium]